MQRFHRLSVDTVRSGGTAQTQFEDVSSDSTSSWSGRPQIFDLPGMPTLRPHLARHIRVRVPAQPAQPAAPNDEQLSEAVRTQLESTGYQQLRRIDVAVEKGKVTLKGDVTRYYLRQMAQQAAMTTDGVDEVESNIQIRK